MTPAKLKILLVDDGLVDDERIQRAFCELTNWLNDVVFDQEEVLFSGKLCRSQAQSELCNQRFDLVVTDNIMPWEDDDIGVGEGYRLLEFIRSSGHDCPVILFSDGLGNDTQLEKLGGTFLYKGVFRSGYPYRDRDLTEVAPHIRAPLSAEMMENVRAWLLGKPFMLRAASLLQLLNVTLLELELSKDTRVDAAELTKKLTELSVFPGLAAHLSEPATKLLNCTDPGLYWSALQKLGKLLTNCHSELISPTGTVQNLP